MFVSELMKAFDGISKKIVKGAMPAVDCAVSYNFAHPNVPLFGFVFGFLGQLVAILGLLVFKSPLFLVPGFVPLFFDIYTLPFPQSHTSPSLFGYAYIVGLVIPAAKSCVMFHVLPPSVEV